MPQILYQPMMEKCFPPLTGIMIRRRIAARVQIPSKVDGGITSKDVVKPLVPSVVSNGPLFYQRCFEANLNGEYFDNPNSNGYYKGIIWESWRGNYSLKSARMMIRRKK